MKNQSKATRRAGGAHLGWQSGTRGSACKTYQKILDRLEQFEAVEAIRVGIAAAEQGRVKPARQALAALQEQLGIRD